MVRLDLGRAEQAVVRACETADDATGLRVAVIEVLRRAVGFDAHVWVLTDPQTTVGCAPYAEVPVLADLPSVVRARYLTPELRWTTLRTPARLSDLRPDQAPTLRAALAAYDVLDIACVVHADRHGTWAFLDLWRVGGDFTDAETDLLTRTRGVLTEVIRRCQAATMSGLPSVSRERSGPGVVLVDDDLRIVGDTDTAVDWLARLLPPSVGQPPVPAVVLNVAAQLLACEAGVDDHPAHARVHLGGGRWITARADRLRAERDQPLIAVSLEETTPRDRLDVYTRAFGLTGRETEIVRLLAIGLDTHAVADRLSLSPHTVQDHLKSVFERTGTRSRPALLSRGLGVGTPG